MADEVVIKCKNDGNTLSFSQRNKEGWTTEIIGVGITAKIKITDFLGDPSSFFSDLASQWQGWEGIKTYRSLEGELAIHARHDKKGTVSLQVLLTPNDRGDDWKLENIFGIDPGQLNMISQEMKDFFSNKVT